MRRLTREWAAAVWLIACGATGCSSPPEDAVLREFFAASRLRDRTALASISTASFEPHLDGIVTEFELTDIAPEQRTAFSGRTFGREADEAKTDDLVVHLSIGRVRHDVDLTAYDGRMGRKTVTVVAPVTLPDGRVVQRTLVVTMQRAVLTADPEIIGRWIVSGVSASPE